MMHQTTPTRVALGAREMSRGTDVATEEPVRMGPTASDERLIVVTVARSRSSRSRGLRAGRVCHD
jgi:hypothetical protein